MPFKPDHLQRHQLPPGIEEAPINREVYSRRDLLLAVPEEERAEYAAAADEWVQAQPGGFVFGTEQHLYIILPGFVWPQRD